MHFFQFGSYEQTFSTFIGHHRHTNTPLHRSDTGTHTPSPATAMTPRWSRLRCPPLIISWCWFSCTGNTGNHRDIPRVRLNGHVWFQTCIQLSLGLNLDLGDVCVRAFVFTIWTVLLDWKIATEFEKPAYWFKQQPLFYFFFHQWTWLKPFPATRIHQQHQKWSIKSL